MGEQARPGARFVRAGLLIALALVDGVLLAWLLVHPTVAFIGWLALRGALSVAATIAISVTSRRGRPSGEDGGLALGVAVWCFALPLFGAAIACLVTWPPAADKPTADQRAWSLWPEPVRWDDPNLKVRPPARHDEPEEVAGDLLLFDRAHDGRRLHALLRAARLPLRFQVPLARQALGDSNDDVRLFAFSLIDRHRREHERAVQMGRATLEQAATPLARAHAHLRLAELAWESAYHGLPEGSALRETLTMALEHVDRSLTISPDEPAAHALRGRILMRLGNPDAAEGALRRALLLRHPAIKVLPHLAECAYERRQFALVRERLARLHALEDLEGPILGRLRAVMEHWT